MDRRKAIYWRVFLLCIYLLRLANCFPLAIRADQTSFLREHGLFFHQRRPWKSASRFLGIFRGGSTSIRLVSDPTTVPTNMAEPVHVIAENDDTTVTVRVHTYTADGIKYLGLNTNLLKFQSFLKYKGVRVNDVTEIATSTVSLSDPKIVNHRDGWRTAWYEGRLVTDRTELLTVYPSDSKAKKDKRGGFADLLSLYCERIYNILVDEREDSVFKMQQPQQPETSGLIGWLHRSYGNQTDQLFSETFLNLTTKEQMRVLKDFLEWFRSEFPYFYDRCGYCGASYKEAKDNDDEHKTFIGYIYPDPSELAGKASRTELFECHKCYSFTRFPRYNSAAHVISHKRGRCGEYSMLIFRILRELGHETRWVVDWADHVWAEIRLHNKWMHLDPCEAAVDENHLYQGWGKKQTFVLGFYLPSIHSMDSIYYKYPLIEDITTYYTSDSWYDICKRRDESEEHIRSSIKKATAELKRKLQQHH